VLTAYESDADCAGSVITASWMRMAHFQRAPDIFSRYTQPPALWALSGQRNTLAGHRSAVDIGSGNIKNIKICMHSHYLSSRLWIRCSQPVNKMYNRSRLFDGDKLVQSVFPRVCRHVSHRLEGTRCSGRNLFSHQRQMRTLPAASSDPQQLLDGITCQVSAPDQEIL